MSDRAELLKKRGFTYDYAKRLWYRHFSSCHNAPLIQRMLYKDKVVTDPNFKLTTSGSRKETITESTNKKWWQFWKPKTIQRTVTIETGGTTQDVKYRYFCTGCNKQNDGQWEFIHE